MEQVAKKKREDLALFIEREIVFDPSVQGIVVIGSVAKGTARADSDIDAVVFLDPFDLYSVPAEAKWRPQDGTFHGIMSHVEDSIQLDFKRLDLDQWSQPTFEWPESMCAEISEGWVAFERDDQIQQLVSKRTKFTDAIRQQRVDDGINHLGWLLGVGVGERTWETLGPTVAHYRLHSACEYLIQALFAYNRRWRTLKSRELTDLMRLPWLPRQFEQNFLLATNALSADKAGYSNRLRLLRLLFDEVLAQCQQDGLYGAEALNEAFIRGHNEPGRDWNMAEWAESHEGRKRSIPR